MPKGKAHAVATIAIRSDSSIAVHSAGERLSTTYFTQPAFRVGGSRRRLYQKGEPKTFKYRLRRLGAQERQILDRIGLGVGGQRYRINDRRMRVLGKDRDDLHAGLDLGVGRVDDPERR